MSTSDHNGRSGVQGPVPDVASHAYRDYGAIEAALGQSQAANNEVPYYRGQGVGIIGKTIVFLILIPFTLICVAIIAGIFGAISGTWIVIGHWILLHLSPAPSPYSEATLWSTFMVGLWGSAATFLPFCVLNASLHVCCMRASCGVGPVLALRFVLGVFKVGLDCVAGVPLVGYYYGMETLGLDYVIRAAILLNWFESIHGSTTIYKRLDAS
ncbi:uncharacterized protein ARMOST_02136 [Armillaria ostoyae]|uniref:Uncharacterized protein n=1 Tax=Armillaria ostoyae TaxID=47428 RepID=A0A284QQV5_ARMOS|nr:uncharacterized protein ARMOST_02136 [Armillaria ostoyae]